MRVEFEEELRFTQFQILWAYRDAHTRGDKLSDKETKLPADDLLALVTARAVERALCEQYLS